MPKKSSKKQPLIAGFDDLFEQSPSVSNGSATSNLDSLDTTDADSDVVREGLVDSDGSVASSSRSAQTKSSPSKSSGATVSAGLSMTGTVNGTTESVPAKPRLPHPSEGDLVILVDSHSLIYQVFHALPAMTSPHGVEVGAVHGFLRDIANLLEQWKPEFLVCTFDASEETFRNELYDQYKAHREPMPDSLREQLPLIHSCLETLAIPTILAPGYEADDIMATLASQAEQHGARVLLVTSDKDCRQLISEKTLMLNVRKNEVFGASELKGVWGIRPDQVVDFQALVGDSVDNVPGVPTIGPKAAQQLLDQFDSLDNIYANLESIPGKRKEKLAENKAAAYLSRDLVRLTKECPISLEWSQMRPGTFDPNVSNEMFRELGFKRLAETFVSLQGNEDAPASVAEQLPVDGYVLIQSEEQLASLAAQLAAAKVIAVDTETTSLRARDAELVGISVSWAHGHAAYIPVKGPESTSVLPLAMVQKYLGPIMSSTEIERIGQNIKYDSLILRKHGLEMATIGFDTMVADYLLDAGGRNHDLDELAKRWLGHIKITTASLIGTGKDQTTMDLLPVQQVADYACEDADVVLRLHEPMKERLASEQLLNVMDRLEIPLISVLSSMEFLGITVNTERLTELGQKFKLQIERLREEIMEMAGEEFNPDSPKQLAHILFDKFQLRVVKKTKTGASTDAEVLEELASEHPLPAKIVEYRQLTKLTNTYIDSLPKLISPNTGRIHTSFRQDIAATGRLSSVEPNLQNIPIRTPEGRSIRSAFVPGNPNWKLMTADYSQIELRVLAHFCADHWLCKAFEDDLDIHTSVAAQVHNVPLEEVTSAMRRSAKAVSFGIIYGQSPFGLAKGLGISRSEAGDFIDAYFAQYPGVRDFITKTLMDCRNKGYVTTMSGRKRFLKGIRDFDSLPDNKKKQLLEPERMAINTVIQGSAADMIKLAMIEIHRQLRETNHSGRMLLQIHDELIFEVPEEDTESLANLVRNAMTTVLPLSVPLKVDVKVGNTWADCELL